MKLVRVYHAGRDAAHRERERALVRAGVELTLVVPTGWPGPDDLGAEPFSIVELPVRRVGDVNRHTYAEPNRIADLVRRIQPDIVDLHEEPFSAAVHQLLRVLPAHLPVVAYAAQNIDKRFPPPFAQWERQALARLQGLYPCTRQAASVAVGKGFRGAVRVLPLAPSPEFSDGRQQAPTDKVALLLVGRLVPEKGVRDAVRVLAAVRQRIDATLDIVGAGLEAEAARALAGRLGVGNALTLHPWLGVAELADRYRAAHVVLAPSRATRTWVEQFGRMVVEAHAAGAVVVGYASGSLPEVVGDAGVVVGEGDEAALARAVLALVDEPSRWKQLRDAGFAARSRTWDDVAVGQIALYEEARSLRPAKSVVAQRSVAVERWGPPAEVEGGGRPFAMPMLRANNPATRRLADLLDLIAGRHR